MATIETKQELGALSYVEWPSIIAGMITALALSFVLLTFGAAVGLSAISPWTTPNSTILTVSFGAVLWMILSYVWSFSLGGYISGRMRHRLSADQAEVDFRDGAHGLLVWASAITLAAVVAALSFSGTTRSDTRVASMAEQEPVASLVDTLLRPVRTGSDVKTGDVRAQTVRSLLRLGSSNATPTAASVATRANLVQLVATHTGASDADAEKRISDTLTELKASTDKARKLAVLFGFITAATLLIAGASAWVAAGLGGKHRDAGTLWTGFSRI